MSELRPQSDFAGQAQEDSGVNLMACYGCKKCSNGCPVTFAMDYHPYQVVRYVQYGLVEKLKDSRTIWVCSACQTCLTRCPNDVDLPRLMDWLKETVVNEGRPPTEKNTKIFHEAFLREVRSRGRVFEGGLMTRYLFKTGAMFGPEAFKYALTGWTMLSRGRMKLVPHGTTDRSWLKEVFDNPEKRE